MNLRTMRQKDTIKWEMLKAKKKIIIQKCKNIKVKKSSKNNNIINKKYT